MPNTVSRVLAALAALVATPFVYVQLFALLERTSGVSDYEALLAADLVTGVLLLIGWIGVWWGAVRWTTRRVAWTAAAVVLSGAVALVVGLVNAELIADEAGIILGGMIWASLWLGSTAFIWRESCAERALRTSLVGTASLHCPQCGYNMRGLREARCPECGTQYTLNELLAAFLEAREVFGERTPLTTTSEPADPA